MQKILSGPREHIVHVAQHHFEAGWRVVPGTLVVSSVEYRPSESYGRERLTEFETNLTVVVEKEESHD